MTEEYKPDDIANEVLKATKNYFNSKRARDYCQRMYDDMLDKVFLDLKFNEEKISIEERKARSRQNETSIKFRMEVSKAQEIMDNCKAELDRVLTKKEFILDANATSRAEAKLGNLIT